MEKRPESQIITVTKDIFFHFKLTRNFAQNELGIFHLQTTLPSLRYPNVNVRTTARFQLGLNVFMRSTLERHKHPAPFPKLTSGQCKDLFF